MTLLDWAPMEAHVHAWCGKRGADPTTTNIATALGVTTQTVYRWRDNGTIPVETADELATAFGLHPLDVWGNDYYTDLPVDLPSTDPEFLAVWDAINPVVMRERLVQARAYSAFLRRLPVDCGVTGVDTVRSGTVNA